MKNAPFNKLPFSDQNAHGLLKEYSLPFKWKLCVSTRALNWGRGWRCPKGSTAGTVWLRHSVAQGQCGTGTPSAGLGCSVLGLGRWQFPREVFYPDTHTLTTVFSLGRKMSLLLNNVFVIIAAALSGFSRMAKSFEMIMLSRFFTGVNAGMATWEI